MIAVLILFCVISTFCVLLWHLAEKKAGHINKSVYHYLPSVQIPLVNRQRIPDYSKLCGMDAPRVIHNFNLAEACARPYRPFRWPYHQTMSLKKMNPDYWLEIESNYVERMAERQKLYEKLGKHVVSMLPGAHFAGLELLQMVCQYYSIKYPTIFHLDNDTGEFYNTLTGKHYNVFIEADPMRCLNEISPNDFGVMLLMLDGKYHLRAGSICSSLGWTLQTKIAKDLDGIHEPIPDYKEKMAFSMNRFFHAITPDKSIERGSWGFEVGEPFNLPPEECSVERGKIHTIDSLDPKEITLRVDWQTLRRLPRSGAVVFSFLCIFTPLEKLRDEPMVPEIALKVLKEGKANMMEYKGTDCVKQICEPLLEQWAKEQREMGLVPKEWEVATIDEAPFFPGWKRKHNSGCGE